MTTVNKVLFAVTASLSLALFGAINTAQAGHPAGSGMKMSGGSMKGSSGMSKREPGKDRGFEKIKFEKDKKRFDEHKYWSRYDYRFRYTEYCYTPVCEVPVVSVCEMPVSPAPVCEVPVSPAPVCEVPVVPVCPEPVCVATPYCEAPCLPYEYGRRYDYRRDWSRDGHKKDSKPTTASSHRNTENLGSGTKTSKPTTASSHRNTENLGSMTNRVAGGRGRK